MTNVLDLIPDEIEVEKCRLINEIRLVCWQVSPIVNKTKDAIERKEQFNLFWEPIYDKLLTLSVIELHELIKKKGLKEQIKRIHEAKLLSEVI